MARTLALSTLALAATSVLAAPAHELHTRTPPGNKKVIIQMFQWNWDSIAQECRNFIGPVGYGFVQVNPPSEHLTGGEWWTDYQVVSYKIQSKRGNRDQFQNMVNTCKQAGVGVLVDIVWNHMAGVDWGQGVAGSGFSHYNYPGIYDGNDFHYCGTPGNDIQNWNDRWQTQNCELANLADLKTDTPKVQDKLVAFTNDLISMGVAGFRIDASKHMPVDDQKKIIGRLTKQGLYYTHEVVYEGGGGVTSGEYTSIGDVQEFRYVTLMRDAFTGNNIAQLQNVNNRGWLPSDKANVFVVNHDRERGGYLSYKSPNNQFNLANVFSLAYPYGTPTVYSGYSFDNSNQGAPNGNYGTCNGAGGANGWQCQHRWTAIAGMVGFYNTVGTSGLAQWKQGNNNQIAFARGNVGYVAINNDGGNWTSTFTTGLPDGKYCDVTTGAKASGGNSCTGKTITVSSGKINNYTLNGRSAFAIHAGSKIA